MAHNASLKSKHAYIHAYIHARSHSMAHDAVVSEHIYAHTCVPAYIHTYRESFQLTQRLPANRKHANIHTYKRHAYTYHQLSASLD